MIAVRAVLAVFVFTAATFAAEPTTKVGPASGSLLVVGGGSMAKLWPVFLELAGGKDAPIVVIPTAGETITGDDSSTKALRALGVAHVTQLHTRDPKEADTEAFVAPLRAARAVWISGGRQWRLADSYLGTRTQKEFFAVLARGGVIGGSSAGATIQGSYLVRGAPSGNTIVMSPGHEVGFGFLRAAAIDQHVDTRKRAEDLRPVLRAHPALLGIALDEATAILVRGDRAEVVGAGSVRFFAAPEAPTEILRAGERYDLAGRKSVVAN